MHNAQLIKTQDSALDLKQSLMFRFGNCVAAESRLVYYTLKPKNMFNIKQIVINLLFWFEAHFNFQFKKHSSNDECFLS